MGKQINENAVRDKFHEMVLNAMRAAGEEPLSVDVAEDSYPTVDEEGNELFVNIKVSIKRGSRVDGGYEPYDGYAEHEEYLTKVAIAEENRKRREEEAKKKAEEKARKATAKKTIKTMKKDVEEIFGGDDKTE